MTWLSNSYPTSLAKEHLQGVTLLHVGPSLGYSVASLIFTYPLFLISAIVTALRLLRTENYDLVIDEVHGLPFFTPLYARSKAVLLVCEVAGSIWDKMYPFPVNRVGKLIERGLYLFVYRTTPIWAISRHTKADVLAINPKASVSILPLGTDTVPVPTLPKFRFPSAVFLARLVKMKGVETAITSVPKIVQSLPSFQLNLIGGGSQDYLNYLHQVVQDLGVAGHVNFLGPLSDQEKIKVLAQCHFLIHPSYKEGFGLTVLEAGLVGTPTIGRSGSSLDELIVHDSTGFLFSSDQQLPDLFTRGFAAANYHRLASRAKAHARKFYWSHVLRPLSQDPKTGIVSL